MLVSPQSLRDCCLEFVGHNIDAEVGDAIVAPLAQHLLEQLSRSGRLSDDVILKPLFQSPLRELLIPDASLLSTRGLRSLRAHALRRLQVCGLSRATINELIGCLGDQSLLRLETLDVSHSVFTNHNKFCVVIGLAKLRSLRALDVSHTDFNGHGLDIVVDDLPLLAALNISATRVRDISSLRKCAHRLRALSLYNLPMDASAVDVIADLSELRALDVSDDSDNPLDVALRPRQHVRRLLSLPLPALHSLDVSGRDGLDSAAFERFLRSHPSLRFVGVLQTALHFESKADLQIAGSADERQILHALRRYDARPNFVQKALFHLYAQTHAQTDARPDLLDAVVQPMRRHARHISVQMAATACLYNLTKGDFGDRLHPRHFRDVVSETLHAMQTFPNHQQLQKNALLTLCSDRVLQDVRFDRFLATQLVLESVVQFKDTAMNRMAVAIVSILAAKISTRQTSTLGARAVYMEALLAIVRTRVRDAPPNDVMLKFTLSALWNLTDESPKTCRMFLQKDGVALYLQVLRRFAGQVSVETKVLGLVNNIAEVQCLRHHLLDQQLLLELRLLLRSDQIDVSYFAAGIFAHLLSDQTLDDRTAILDELVRAVLSWETPDIEMVAYRSFVPFLPLLRCVQWPPVQLWAVWAIHHVCSKNPSRYVDMLVAEDGAHTIGAIADSAADDALRQYCRRVLRVVQNQSH